MYLISIKYDNDAERKRLEYVFEKWTEKLKIKKLDSMAAIINEDGDAASVEDFVRELYSRSSPASTDSLTIYKIEPAKLGIEKETKELSLDLPEKRETVEKLLGYIMARQKAAVKPTGVPSITNYEVTTKKGTAEIMVMLKEKPDSINVRIKISGYGEVVDFIYGRLNEELKFIGGEANDRL